MKEKIYTIPVNEAFDENSECPFCLLHKQLETEGIEYALGAAMMEPDHRIQSNDIGFCNKHFSMLYAFPNRLSLALVLDTHLAEIRNKLGKVSKKAENLKNGGGSIFKKSDAKVFGEELDKILTDINKGCVVCDKIEHTMERYYEVAVYLWATESEFKKKFDNSKGVCLEHFKHLSNAAVKYLNRSQSAEFISDLFKKQQTELERIQEDIHKFTLKFDYRNKDMEWGTAKDAPIRTIEKISGYITKDDE